MEIREIDVFDLYGDGTLVIKTNMTGQADDLRYAWYIELNSKKIFKGSYQHNPFMSYKIDQPGKYVVKAFVKNSDQDKVQSETEFTANKKTSPALIKDEVKTFKLSPFAEHISDTFWKMDVKEKLADNAKYAWYLYRVNEQEPCIKQLYTPISEYVCSLKDPGEYYAKVFAVVDGIKHTAKTDVFLVK
ncbi:MAG: hypothetical protein Q4F95_02555 [Oscillospiraceae bacterium]|nr:hypothetical protein [Oscillospiraceae bacterium]